MSTFWEWFRKPKQVIFVKQSDGTWSGYFAKEWLEEGGAVHYFVRGFEDRHAAEQWAVKQGYSILKAHS